MAIQLSEWQGADDMWHAAYTDSFKAGVSNFALVAHGCGMLADEYVRWVINNFKPDVINYTSDYSAIFFKWKSQSAMRKYKNTVNKLLRDKKLI